MHDQFLSDLTIFLRNCTYFLWCHATKVRSERSVCGCQTFRQSKQLFLMKTDLHSYHKKIVIDVGTKMALFDNCGHVSWYHLCLQTDFFSSNHNEQLLNFRFSKKATVKSCFDTIFYKFWPSHNLLTLFQQFVFFN